MSGSESDDGGYGDYDQEKMLLDGEDVVVILEDDTSLTSKDGIEQGDQQNEDSEDRFQGYSVFGLEETNADETCEISEVTSFDEQTNEPEEENIELNVKCKDDEITETDTTEHDDKMEDMGDDEDIWKEPQNEAQADELLEKDEEKAASPDKDTNENGSQLGHDTEMVSEDELLSDTPKAQLDTEAVSDDELPGPTQAELLDTEAVSEDELPPVKKKRKHSRRHSSDSEKRPKIDKEKESSKKNRDSKSPSKKEKESKALPELEKFWKAVKEDPSDFTGWTYLLQYVDQENDLEAAREAYDKFLSHYPYCYGYWRKYADYEKKKAGENSKSEEVFERGLNAIPLSVDLWLHYLNYCKSIMKDDEEKLRGQYDRAIEECGLEFRSDRLWDSYIKWELENKNYQCALNVYDRLLKTPTQGYNSHFEAFEEFVKSHHPKKILSVDEFLELRKESLQKIKEKGPSLEPSAAPPGDESEDQEKIQSDEETAIMKEKIILSRKKKFKNTVTEVLARWNFEEGIKRPYFHVKPLERLQLNTWRDYLDFEINTGNQQRIMVLFERCLIACALYEEFWVKYIKYLETLDGDHENDIRKIYTRACTIHHPTKPYLSLNWASFEESHNNSDEARKILAQIDKEVPNLMLVHLRRINLERRCGKLEEACNLYENYLANTKSKVIFVTLAIKYSRFCWKVLNDVEKGIEVLKNATERNDDVRLHVQLLDLLLINKETNENECVSVFNNLLERETLDLEDKIIFAQRRIEFLEDFGQNIIDVQKAQTEYFSILKQLKESRKQQKDDKKDDKKIKDTNNYSSTYSSAPSSYNYQSGQYGPQGYSQANQYPDQNSAYSNWNYSQSGNYGNGNQSWGGYNYYS